MSAAPKDTSMSNEAGKLDTMSLVKDLLFTGLLTLLILTPIVTYKTTMNQGVLVISSRWMLALALTAIVVGARAFLHLFVWHKAPSPKAAAAKPVSTLSVADRYGKYVAPGLLIFAPWTAISEQRQEQGENQQSGSHVFPVTVGNAQC